MSMGAIPAVTPLRASALLAAESTEKMPSGAKLNTVAFNLFTDASRMHNL